MQRLGMMTCLRDGYLRMRKRLFCREVGDEFENEGFRVVMKRVVAAMLDGMRNVIILMR